MPTYLFENFLEDDSQYYEAKSFLESLFFKCVDSSEGCLWEPWLGCSREGNPIFSVAHKNLPRGISIHLEHPSEVDVPYFAVVERIFGESGMAGTPIDHTMIICKFSEENVSELLQAIQEFVKSTDA